VPDGPSAIDASEHEPIEIPGIAMRREAIWINFPLSFWENRLPPESCPGHVGKRVGLEFV
jgi:hypothetical protein